jgi:hypothetical protein
MDLFVVQLCIRLSLKRWWFARIVDIDSVRHFNRTLFTSCATNCRFYSGIVGKEDYALQARV